MRRFLLFVLVTLALACASPATAGSLGLTGTGKGVSGITIGGSEARYSNVFAGDLDWSWLTTPSPGFQTAIYIYWVDILHDVLNTEPASVQSADLLASSNLAPDAGAKAAWLVAYAANDHASGTSARAADLQFAIWEALHGTRSDDKKGNASFHGLKGQTGRPDLHHIPTAVLHHHITSGEAGSAGQDHVTNVPEPGSLWLVALGAIALFEWRRRQQTLEH